MSLKSYKLDAQIGFLLRKANQRHLSIFSSHIAELTPTQFAVIAKLTELGRTSQNRLGRATAMDAATIKGVVDRLAARGLVRVTSDENDRRRVVVELTEEASEMWLDLRDRGFDISAETLEPLDMSEQAVLIALLKRLT